MTIPNRPIPGADPVEEPESPGQTPTDTPTGRETERRDELAERTGSGRPSPAGGDRPDLITGTDVPDAQM